MADQISWLPECSVDAVRALRARVPDLAESPVVFNPRVEESDPEWFASTAVVGARAVVKFAWSRPAAQRVA